MPLRPIDLQVLIPRVSTSHHGKQTLANQQNAMLQNSQIEQQKTDIRERKTVQSLNKADSLSIRRDKQKHDDQKRRRQQEQQEQQDDLPPEEQHLDITI